MEGGAIERLCSGDSVHVLLLTIIRSGMGQKRSWVDTKRILDGRITQPAPSMTTALLALQGRIAYQGYFATDPRLDFLTHRLLWRGHILRLSAPPYDPSGCGNFWVVSLELRTEDQPGASPEG